MPPRHRPPWWPENEPWPPPMRAGAWGGPGGSWGGPPWWGPGRRGGLRRGFGCLIVMLATLIVSVGVLVLWLLASLLGNSSEEPLGFVARPAALVVLVVGFIALVVAIRIARGVGRPLSDLVDAAGKVEAGDYSVRVPEPARGRGELRGLSRAFNAMTARLETEDTTRRRLLADVSHELRTPLAVIQGNLEALVDGVYPPDEAHLRPILDETKVLERLVDDLRTLSLADSGALPLHREPTAPAVLLEDVAAAHRANATAAGIEIRVDAAIELPPVDVDPMRIKQVISNLVENAIRAMPGGGSISISARAQPDALVIEVTDTGPGIAPELRSTLFERFTKSAGSRGSGLGLAIARAIVTAHGGTIEAAAGRDGAGTTLRISLPTPA
ncbi:MAG TPA: ATP-binding protein [Patescibacteria group bacterium]|jgi:two-component system sensor histidine kinase BaeS|nr:ATP-binding protein [Patescibacteria group bacterium]